MPPRSGEQPGEEAVAPPGPVALAIHDKLVDALTPIALQVLDESHGHSGNRKESHFKVVVVTAAFEGVSLVKRHRHVNTLLAQELAGGVHALSIFAYTAQQWEKRGGEVPASPPCRGGG
ncbi:MAG: BolA family transcriptional regulator [Nannocystaceae bacterium]|nr:BolA family transcriptional regulator [Nannocystaceae bacterium]